MRRIVFLFLALVLVSCGREPVPANPALWEVQGPSGEQAWLFGTIHAFERPVAWRSPDIDRALDRAGMLMVEVADLDDRAAMDETFARLAATPGQPPISHRVRPELRAELAALLSEHGLAEGQFGNIETWAAALMLAQAASADLDRKHGIDRAVMKAMKGKPVAELEGAEHQLSLFDQLPEAEQRDLLEAVIRDAGSLSAENADLAEAWRTGDMETITQETNRGMLADPELREVLFTGRNEAWARRIAADLSKGKRPFVAVGAAHMAGPEGLPQLLAKRGYTIRRIQ